MLILVRHAMPTASPEVPPRAWPLSPAGITASERLRGSLPSGAYLVSSTEPKAWHTLGGQAAEVIRDARFDEISRGEEPWDSTFRVNRRRYVEGTSQPGWERHTVVAARFQAGATYHQVAAAGRPLVIATHGMALTTWLVVCGVIEPRLAGAFWDELQFPDCFVLDLDARSVHRYP
ncbi:MAG: histidine phosphatase family protein [Nocardioidaceae bacterium]